MEGTRNTRLRDNDFPGQLLISRVIGKVKSSEIHMDGLSVDRDLARRQSLFVDLPRAPT